MSLNVHHLFLPLFCFTWSPKRTVECPRLEGLGLGEEGVP